MATIATKHMKSLLLFTMVVLMLTPVANAQTVEALAKAESDSLLIGGQLKVQLLLKLPKGFRAEWPSLGDTLSKQIEIVSKSAPETIPLDDNKNILMRQELTISTFDTGWISIPPVPIRFAPPDDSLRFTAITNPLMIRVFLPDVDTTEPFKPIKEIEKQPITIREILPWLIGLLLLGGLLWVVIRRYKQLKNRSVAPVPMAQPAIPPHKAALEQLEQLRYEKLWQNGRLKEYYTRLSDIARVYIEAQFPVNAVEMTTNEILQCLRPLGINEEARQKLKSALELADLVKFAKFAPSSIENELAINHIIDFVVESYASVVQSDELLKKEEKA